MQKSVNVSVSETDEQRARGREAAQAQIMAQGGEIDPEGDKLEAAYNAVSETFDGITCEGMLKVLSAYVVDQAFAQGKTYTEGVAAAEEFSKTLYQGCKDYAQLKLRGKAEGLSKERLKAEIDSAIKIMQTRPGFGSPELLEAMRMAQSLAKVTGQL
jgi:hypothetical protein